ncbi:hypothetical protein AAVH_08525 [Aphelenchoides avenae]|nr:hypothetical protein AAVH_08525 [Aphelenchus avenae]
MPYEAVPLRPLNGSRAKLMRTPEVRLRAVSIHDDVSNEIAEVVDEIADDFPSPLPLFNEVDAETGNSDEAQQQLLEDKSDAILLPKV